jgi:hypothetical protein
LARTREQVGEGDDGGPVVEGSCGLSGYVSEGVYVDELKITLGGFAALFCVSLGLGLNGIVGLLKTDCDVLDVCPIYVFIYKIYKSGDCGLGDRGWRPVHGEAVGDLGKV